METRHDNMMSKLAEIEAMLKKLRLTNITRYNDVEEGWLVLNVGTRVKSWRAVWLTQLRLNSRGPCNLPRGDFTLRYAHHGEWIDCPKIRLSLKSSMWIEPLQSRTWEEMGASVYLCSGEGWPDSMSISEYKKLTSALQSFGITQLTIDEPQQVVNEYRCGNQAFMGMEDFWED